MKNWTLGLILSLAFACGLAAQTPPSAPATALLPASDLASEQDADADAIDSLVRRGMLDRAEALARQQLDAVELSADEAAKWAIALSNVRLAKLLRAPLADQSAYLESAVEPLDRILAAYPDHRRAPWLRFQQSVVELATARRRGFIVLATPGEESQRLGLLATLIGSAGLLQELEREAAEEIAAAFQRRDRSAWIDELMALRNAIAVKRVEILLLRGELFAAGSDDFLAAAGEAQQAAIDALALVRQDPARRDELVRMWCEALLRIGQAERAAELLAPLMSGDRESPPPDDATLALAVRIALELGQAVQAEQMLINHYGDSPTEAPAAPESDLARLRFLIAIRATEGDEAKLHEQLIGDWIEAIRQRGGDFAHRRAEMIATEALGGRSGEASDHRIVIAQAAALLRAGQTLAAAEMLEDAARQAGDAASARRLTIPAAAAYDQVQYHERAVTLLREMAIAHEQDPASADLHLQAAVLLSQIDQPDSAAAEPTAGSEPIQTDHVNTLLRQTMLHWPDQPAAQHARRWLVARLLASGKPTEAAIAASPTQTHGTTQEQWEEAARLWIEALAAVPLLTADFSVNESSRRLLRRALEHLPPDVPAARRSRMRVIVLLGEMSDVAVADEQPGDEPLIDWLLRVRRGAQFALPPKEESAVVRRAAVQRLVADGMAAPAKRSRLAEAILQLSGDEPSLARAHALLWSGDWQTADAVLDQWVTDHPAGEPPNAAITAARLLAHSSHPAAKRRALERYHAVGAQLIQGSESWHQVKLATIELMSELGQAEDASRLAKYILLTRPPDDQAFQASYRRWAEQ